MAREANSKTVSNRQPALWVSRMKRVREQSQLLGIAVNSLPALIFAKFATLSQPTILKILKGQKRTRHYSEIIMAAADIFSERAPSRTAREYLVGIYEEDTGNRDTADLAKIQSILPTEVFGVEKRISNQAAAARKKQKEVVPRWHDARTGEEISIIHPLVQKALFHDEEADAYRALKHLEYDQAKSYGRIFEIRNWILAHASLTTNGLSSADIFVDRPIQEFTSFDPKIIDEQTVNLLTEAGKHNPNDNGIKVSLVGLFPPDISDENPRAVRLKTARSDYYSNMGALATIRRDRRVRHENMSLEPEDHHIPNAISIHYIIRFSDRKFLASHRSKTLSYDPERVSFSGNEQLKPEDFVNERPLERFMSRALLEEVFPMRDFAMEAPEVAEALSLVAFGRYLSLYLEEKVANFGLVCFIQLNIPSGQFAGKYYGRQLGARFRRDREGEPYLLTEKELSRFFQTGKCDFRGLTNDDRILSVGVDGLEAEGTEVLWRLDSSSLYRMWLAGQLVGVLQF